MEGIQTFKGSWPWPWPWIRLYGIPSCIIHRPLPIYQISFKSKKLFVDGRTYGRTFSPYIIRSTFGSRPNNNGIYKLLLIAPYSHNFKDAVANICHWQHFFDDDLSIKTRLCVVCLARAMPMGVANLCNACSDWSTVKKHRPVIQWAVANNICNKCRCCQHTSPTSVGNIFVLVRNVAVFWCWLHISPKCQREQVWRDGLPAGQTTMWHGSEKKVDEGN